MDHKFLIMFIMIIILEFSRGKWKNDRRPKVYGDKIPFEAILSDRRGIQHKIVLFHNHFRAKVQPRASNMLRMKWHKGAAEAAQRWAEECMFLVHDNVTGRYIDEYGACGQNIFVSSHKVPWLFAVKTWFLEKNDFTYGSNTNDLKLVGHYTQMVWAATHEVGCGISRCYTNRYFQRGVFYNYVCNYCPIFTRINDPYLSRQTIKKLSGNRQNRLGRPYRRGKSCGRCKRHCHKKRLCTNSCPYADFWINCKELYTYWPAWLCNSASEQGKERAASCRATCKCRGRIHD